MIGAVIFKMDGVIFDIDPKIINNLNKKSEVRLMLILLDTANLEQIKKFNDSFPIEGVTTNPTLISNENKDFFKILKDIRDIISEEKMIHVQTVGTTSEEIVKEAEYLNKEIGGNLYIKVPVTPDGIKAIMILEQKGIKTTATAVFTPMQALVAAQAGADFVAPYVNRLDNIAGDGLKVVGEIAQIFNLYKLNTKVLAASFKNVEQVHKAALSGVEFVTVSPEIIGKLLYHPLTNLSVDQFIKDWEGVYGHGKRTDNLK